VAGPPLFVLLLRRSPAWRGWGTVTLLASLATSPSGEEQE
jgi:hypothetical protein